MLTQRLISIQEAERKRISQNLHDDFGQSMTAMLLRLNAILNTVLYRFVQEGLNNVVKYAKATSVWINLDDADEEVSLSLEDNGQGFDLKAMKNGMGLRGLEERFKLLNGRFEIETTPGEGTRICGFLPLANRSYHRRQIDPAY